MDSGRDKGGSEQRENPDVTKTILLFVSFSLLWVVVLAKGRL